MSWVLFPCWSRCLQANDDDAFERGPLHDNTDDSEHAILTSLLRLHSTLHFQDKECCDTQSLQQNLGMHSDVHGNEM
jgi:hypothetical protein